MKRDSGASKAIAARPDLTIEPRDLNQQGDRVWPVERPVELIEPRRAECEVPFAAEEPDEQLQVAAVVIDGKIARALRIESACPLPVPLTDNRRYAFDSRLQRRDH